MVDKKMKNEMFFVAIDYLFDHGLVESQKELAEKIGISEAGLSRIRNGKKYVSDDTIRKMNHAFGLIFNMAYFRGESLVLLLEDLVPAKTSRFQSNEIDSSSAINAALASRDVIIAKLEDNIADLRASIQDKEKLLAAKDEIITLLRQQLASIRSYSDYPSIVAEEIK